MVMGAGNIIPDREQRMFQRVLQGRPVLIPGNGRLMSPWPVRTGVVVRDDRAYFCTGLFPSEGAWLCAVGARSGREAFRVPLDGTHPQGYMLASQARLY